jgi:hypothetical protein
MTARNNRNSQRRKPPRQRSPDEDDHPIEGYRDGSVYEEQGEDARVGQLNDQNPPNKPRVSGNGRNDKLRGVKSGEKRK